MAGRKQREQSWIRQLPSGRYRARYVAADGTERGETFDRKADAESWRTTQLADVARGRWVDPALGKLTFAEYVAIWEAGLHGLRDSSVDRYLGIVRNHLVPRFGKAQLALISPSDVKAMVADDLEAGYSSSTVRRHVIVLRGVLDAAIADGRLTRNVASGFKLPAESARPMRFLTPVQLAQTADCVRAHYRPLVMTAGWVGLRWGELAGLAVANVDLLRHTMVIDRQLTEVKGRLAFGGPKTRSGVRRVSIPAQLSSILAVHFNSDAVKSSGLAFPSVRGLSMRRSNFRKAWRRAVDGLFAGTDLEGLVFHELRHTAAALMIEQGAHPLTVKERLGHSSITVTMDTYGHLFPSQDQALAEALNETLRESLEARRETGTVTEMRRRRGGSE